MSRARITIATSGPLCRNPRVHREADALAQDGHDVTVVTVAYHDRFERLDADLMREARYRKVRIDRRPSQLLLPSALAGGLLVLETATARRAATRPGRPAGACG